MWVCVYIYNMYYRNWSTSSAKTHSGWCRMRTFQGSTEIPNPSAPGPALRASAPPPEVKDLVNPPGAWKWWMGQTWDTMKPTKIAKFWSCQPSQNIPKYKMVVNNPEPSHLVVSVVSSYSFKRLSFREEWVRWVINAQFTRFHWILLGKFQFHQ